MSFSFGFSKLVYSPNDHAPKNLTNQLTKFLRCTLSQQGKTPARFFKSFCLIQQRSVKAVYSHESRDKTIYGEQSVDCSNGANVTELVSSSNCSSPERKLARTNPQKQPEPEPPASLCFHGWVERL